MEVRDEGAGFTATPDGRIFHHGVLIGRIFYNGGESTYRADGERHRRRYTIQAYSTQTGDLGGDEIDNSIAGTSAARLPAIEYEFEATRP